MTDVILKLEQIAKWMDDEEIKRERERRKLMEEKKRRDDEQEARRYKDFQDQLPEFVYRFSGLLRFYPQEAFDRQLLTIRFQTSVVFVAL